MKRSFPAERPPDAAVPPPRRPTARHPRGLARFAAGALAFLLGFAAAAAAAAAVLGTPETYSVDRVEVRRLTSKANAVAYKLYVALPHGYSGDALAPHGTIERQASYPVVYLLDADYSFPIARAIADHLAERGDLPRLILVGIAYDGPPRYRLHRTRDYTPTFVADGAYGPQIQRHSGGGRHFLKFLAEELAPAIEGAYRATPGDRTLVGHSFGGLFATWALFERPGLFRRVVAVSPSLWYDDRVVFRRERAYGEHHSRLPARLYYGVGAREINRERSMVADLETFTRALRARDYAGLELGADVLDDETHNSVFPRALSNGLRFVFGAR